VQAIVGLRWAAEGAGLHERRGRWPALASGLGKKKRPACEAERKRGRLG
jgi:hypothetical protein